MVLAEKAYCKYVLVIDSKFVDSSDDVILLGKTIYKKQTVSKYVGNLCRNAQYSQYNLMPNITYAVMPSKGYRSSSTCVQKHPVHETSTQKHVGVQAKFSRTF